MTTKCEPTADLLRSIRDHAWQLGWALREVGVGVQSNEDGSIRLTAYRSDAPLPAASTELLEGLQDGWQAADECSVID